jgi:hypothetical protein
MPSFSFENVSPDLKSKKYSAIQLLISVASTPANWPIRRGEMLCQLGEPFSRGSLSPSPAESYQPWLGYRPRTSATFLEEIQFV